MKKPSSRGHAPVACLSFVALVFVVSLAPLPAAQAADEPFVHFAPAPFFSAGPQRFLTEDFSALDVVVLQTPVLIDPTFLKEKLAALTGKVAVRIGTKSVRIKERYSEAGLNKARAFLTNEYEALGFTVSMHDGFGGTNLVAEKPGVKGKAVLILSSHLDAVEAAPGADDDGSGTITALAIARALAGQQFEHTLRVVAFDQEEAGLIGSQAYVEHLQENGDLRALIGDIQLEMTGYNPHSRNNIHIIDCDDAASHRLSRRIARAIRLQHIPLTNVRACTDASDHASFWQVNKAAVVVSENFFGGDGNPCYHDTCDVMDNLDFKYMANIGSAVGAVVASLLKPYAAQNRADAVVGP